MLFKHIATSYTGSDLKKLFRNMRLIYCIIALLVLASLFYQLYQRQIPVIPMILSYLVFVTYTMLIMSVFNASKLILFQELDVQRYRDAINETHAYPLSISQKSGVSSLMGSFFKTSLEKARYYMELCKIANLSGDFEASKTYLEEFSPDDFKMALRHMGVTDYYFYSYLTDLQTAKQPLNLSDYIDSILALPKGNRSQRAYVDRHVSCLKAIELVMVKKEETDYFDITTVQNNLSRLLYSFYGAINHLNQGNTLKARTLFESIIDKNPELFYVREAKKYLEVL